MNRQEKDKKRREALNLIRMSNRSGSHLNCVRFFRNNTWEHEMVKAQVCLKLLKQGYDLFTECIFENGRADIMAIAQDGSAYIIEVLNSETEERFLAKQETYPDIPIIKIYCKNFEINDWDL